MNTKTSKEFGESVIRHFQPLSERAALPIRKLRDDIYEIAGRDFVMRIRQGTGHRKDFVVTLAPKMTLRNDLDDLGHEIGLGVIAEYNRKPLQVHDDYQHAFAEVARVAEALCLPYLLGAKTDFEEIRRFVQRKVEESGVQTKEYHFPRNVRKEWL